MVSEGFDADLVHEIESVSTIAFGRLYFEPHGVQYSPTAIRARRDGSLEQVALMSIPAYSRARAIGAELRETMTQDGFQELCLYNAESHAILQAIESSDEVEIDKINLLPCIVPDRETSSETMDRAMALLEAMINERDQAAKKPWWKFW